jgi:hypothetical protein
MTHPHQIHNSQRGLTHVAKTTEALTSFGEMELDAVIRLDLRYCADTIENVCGDALADPPEGIYLFGRLDPVMTEGHQYYWKEKNELQPVTDINVVESSVYDSHGKCVIPGRYMREKAKFLSNSPMMPYRGLYITKHLIDNQINSFISWRRGSGATLTDLIGKHFKDTVELTDEQIDLIESCYGQLRHELSNFLGLNTWSMFFTKLQTTSMHVQRGMDWRAWEWERLHGESWREGRYSGNS